MCPQKLNRPSVKQATPRGVAGRTRAPAILVVDDNEDMTRLLELLLRKWGYDVRTALNAPQALETLMFFRADVAILDIGLPEMDGYELAQRIAATCGAIRLIAMSGFGDEAHRRRSAEAGFAGYLVKPVAALDLKAELERVAYSAIA